MPFTQEQIAFLTTDPSIDQLKKTLDYFEECLEDNLDSFPYDKIHPETRKQCLFTSILKYIRNDMKEEGMDAKWIAKTMNWDRNSLKDTSPRESIICDVFPEELKTMIGLDKFSQLELELSNT